MKNIYKPIEVSVSKATRLSHDVKLLRFVRSDSKGFARKGTSLFTPGQFVLAGRWGYGEAPFGPSSDPADSGAIEIIVRKAGQVTAALHSLKKGDGATLRGPYGTGYPLKFFEGKDVLLVTGGCGLPPIASLIRHIIKERQSFGNVTLVYGAATPGDLLLKAELKRWQSNIDVVVTIDHPYKGWNGNTGFVSKHLGGLAMDPSRTVVAMCGPGPMVGSIEHLLNDRGIPDRRIFVSMERRMQCGVGRCQHCVCGTKYVCTDGPVFNLDQVDGSWD